MYIRVSGLSLIEVLVTLTIFSIGLLGLGALQVIGLRMAHDSSLRNVAATHAADMADRIRANPIEANNGLTSTYNNAAGAATASSACLGLDGGGDANGSSCSPSDMALHDFAEWQSAITGSAASGFYPAMTRTLPNGQGIVCIDSTPNDGAPPPGDVACDNIVPAGSEPAFTIKVWWTERKDTSGTNRYVTSILP